MALFLSLLVVVSPLATAADTLLDKDFCGAYYTAVVPPSPRAPRPALGQRTSSCDPILCRETKLQLTPDDVFQYG